MTTPKPDFEKIAREIVGWLYKEQAPSSNIVPIWHVHSTYGILKQDILKALSEAYAAGREDVLAKWPSDEDLFDGLGIKNLHSPMAVLAIEVTHWLRNRLTIVNKDKNEL